MSKTQRAALKQLKKDKKMKVYPFDGGIGFALLSDLNDISKIDTAQQRKFSIKDFFSKCDQIRRNPRIWSHLLKKILLENSIFCAVFLTGKLQTPKT